jgi:Nitroreductase family
MMEDTLTRQTAERLIEAAAAAPSVHNSQPWRFVAWPAGRVIEIHADPARALRRADPRGRAVHIAAAPRCSTSAWPSPGPAMSRGNGARW